MLASFIGFVSHEVCWNLGCSEKVFLAFITTVWEDVDQVCPFKLMRCTQNHRVNLDSDSDGRSSPAVGEVTILI